MYKAQQFKAPDKAEVSGVILQAYLHNLESSMTQPILEKYGFTDEDFVADEWYPNQLFLDIERAIFEQPSGGNALVAIGKAAVENFIPPANMETLEDAIQSLPGVYTTNQRNLPEGYGWIVEKVADNHYVFTNNTGTSNHGAYGYVWAMCNRMKAKGQHVRVAPRQGFNLDSTDPAVIDITW